MIQSRDWTLFRSSEWTYVFAMLAAFVFTPELRRVMDWKGSFVPINSYAVIPLLMLCPIAVFAWRRRSRLRSGEVKFVAFAWLLAFAYSSMIAVTYGTFVQALYADAVFCLPLIISLWLVTQAKPMVEAHAYIGRMLLILGTLTAAYGIYQYIVAPPWDANWVANFGQGAFGTPEPFGIRVFGTLNSAGPFAFFVSAAITWNLPYLSLRRWPMLVAILIMMLGLFLSFIRTAWIGLAFAIVIYIILSPERMRALASTACVAAIAAAGLTALFYLAPENVGTKITERLGTFVDLQNDGSALDRKQTTEAALQTALNELVGAGLGLTVSGADQLADSDLEVFRGLPPAVIDNGFVSRFLEMGAMGFAALLIACVAALGFLLRAQFYFTKQREKAKTLVCSSCIATVAVIFMLNFSGDNQQGLIGVLFFAALALPFMNANPTRSTSPSRTVRPSSTSAPT